MNKSQLYKWSTIFLLLINIGMLTFFFSTKPSHPNEDRFRKTVKEELNLNSSQEKLFLKSAEKHEESISALNNQQKELWIEYFNTLKTTANSTEKDSISSELQQIELQKVKVTYQHFEEVKSFLNQRQMDGFEIFLARILERITKKEKNIPRPPKDF